MSSFSDLKGELCRNDQHQRRRSDAVDQREGLQRIVGQLLVERHIGRHDAVGAVVERVTVRLRACDVFRRNDAAGARLVLDDHRLPELFAEGLGNHARALVADAAGRKADDPCHGACGKILRACASHDCADQRHCAAECCRQFHCFSSVVVATGRSCCFLLHAPRPGKGWRPVRWRVPATLRNPGPRSTSEKRIRCVQRRFGAASQRATIAYAGLEHRCSSKG